MEHQIETVELSEGDLAGISAAGDGSDQIIWAPPNYNPEPDYAQQNDNQSQIIWTPQSGDGTVYGQSGVPIDALPEPIQLEDGALPTFTFMRGENGGDSYPLPEGEAPEPSEGVVPEGDAMPPRDEF
ncbi:hypothetical protein [Streptomyces sp. NPDC088725]|uniref:hypothetical protein n=1 Tax=Streptomyces sp. NPDC088725 TaxID=3365873 RepID=UPI00380B597B